MFVVILNANEDAYSKKTMSIDVDRPHLIRCHQNLPCPVCSSHNVFNSQLEPSRTFVGTLPLRRWIGASSAKSTSQSSAGIAMASAALTKPTSRSVARSSSWPRGTITLGVLQVAQPRPCPRRTTPADAMHATSSTDRLPISSVLNMCLTCS